jgi:hypothetical protein
MGWGKQFQITTEDLLGARADASQAPPRPGVSPYSERPGATHRAAAPPAPRRPGTAPAGSAATFTGVRPPAGTPACSTIPGWRPPPGPESPGVRRHPAGSPAILEPGPRARRHPGIPAGLPFIPAPRPSISSTARGTASMRQARWTGTPAHLGNPGRPCRRQMRMSTSGMAMYKYALDGAGSWVYRAVSSSHRS